jgi:hypothetical protein
VKPSSKNYSFVAVPAATQQVMENIAAQAGNDGGNLFTIRSQSASMHALTYKPKNITAYSFFEPVNNILFGIVRSVTSPHLLMDKADEQTGRHYFAVSNPNLNPQTNSVYGWIAAPTQTTITLAGEWLPIDAVDGVQFAASAGQTQVTVTMNNGEPVYFGIKTVDDTKMDAVNSGKWLTPVNIAIYSTTGTLLYKMEGVSPKNGYIELPVIDHLPPGIYLCVMSDANRKETVKFIK